MDPNTTAQGDRYREIAEELRLVIPKMKHAEVAEELRALAITYERLAEHAEWSTAPQLSEDPGDLPGG